ncbi:MAG: DUF72 domain-containing protein [Janthinobacterium lividum]
MTSAEPVMEKTAVEVLEAKEARKRKRAERREKQRVANVKRAEKMHKLRLRLEEDHALASANSALAASSASSVAGPEATPAPTPAAAPTSVAVPLPTQAPAPVQSSADDTNIHIGCSGWFYWRWRNDFYPQDMPTSEWFSHYAAHFKTVEINASFYSWPTEATVKTWIKQAGEREFVYTVKVCELITHIKKFEETQTLVKDFGLIANLLGAQMGCFLFQLPPSVHYSQAGLDNILGQLDHTRRNVVEFRHASWWNETVYAAFRKTGTIFCSCSGPRLPDELVTTSDDIYLRLHGVKQWYKHDYSAEELGVWCQRILASGARRIWVYFNNDYDGYATRNAQLLSTLLNQARLQQP